MHEKLESWGSMESQSATLHRAGKANLGQEALKQTDAKKMQHAQGGCEINNWAKDKKDLK